MVSPSNFNSKPGLYLILFFLIYSNFFISSAEEVLVLVFHSWFVRLSRPQRPVTLHVLLTSPESKYHPATFFWCTVRPRIELGIIRSRVRCLDHYTTQAVLLFYSGFVQLSRPQRPVTLHVLLTNPESKYHPATFFRCMVRPRIVVLYHFGAFWL